MIFWLCFGCTAFYILRFVNQNIYFIGKWINFWSNFSQSIYFFLLLYFIFSYRLFWSVLSSLSLPRFLMIVLLHHFHWRPMLRLPVGDLFFWQFFRTILLELVPYFVLFVSVCMFKCFVEFVHWFLQGILVFCY